MIAGLRNAGAISWAKRKRPRVFAYNDPAITRNPWNPDDTPGGSSSGSGAAAVWRTGCARPLWALRRGVRFSGRPPTTECVGFKATYGAVSNEGVLPNSWSMDQWASIAGRRPTPRSSGPASARRAPAVRPDAGAAPPIPRPDCRRPAASSLRTGFFEAETASGCPGKPGFRPRTFPPGRREIVEIKFPPSFAFAGPCWNSSSRPETLRLSQAPFRSLQGRLSTEAQGPFGEGESIPGYQYVGTPPLWILFQRDVREDGSWPWSAVMMPTASTTAPQGYSFTDGTSIFNQPWSVAGFPAMSLPTGMMLPTVSPSDADGGAAL